MTVSDGLVLFGGMKLPIGLTGAIVALDAETGQEAWRAEISGRIAAMIVVGDRVLVLTESNILHALALESGESISTTNVGGRAKPNGSISYAGDFRLAVIDDLLIAVLSDGSVAGIDLETGNGRWWALRETPGETQVAVVDNALIVVARGKAEMIEFDENGSPVAAASPIPLATPEAVSCARSVELAIPGPTIDGNGLQAGEFMISRLDLAEGTTIWNAGASGYYHLGFESDAGILSSVIGWPIDRTRIALCATDPASGRLEPVERLTDVAQQIYLIQTASSTDGEEYEILIGVDGANGSLWLPAAFEPSVTGPRIVDSTLFEEGSNLFLTHGNALYLTFDDGSVSKWDLFPDS
jgi:hypothetical protein